jgi:hypothetical protein
MTSIGPSSVLLAEIRAQALAYRRQAGPQAPRAGERQDPRPRPSSSQDWAAEVTRGVLAISPDDPRRQRKAFRAYLRVVLAKECGFQNLDDPGFQALVDRVEEAMDLDPRLRDAMKAAGRLLLESAER